MAAGKLKTDKIQGLTLPGLAECRRCPRLVRYLETLPPRRGLSRADYHNAPVPGFGDPQARICLVGLAPGAHGANRTGRPFTGDGAGDFMYPLLFRAGFSNQPEATEAQDGLELRGLYIANAVRCVPPGNRPATEEFSRCRPWLKEELTGLSHLRVVLLLGRGAFASYLQLLKAEGKIRRFADFPFAHGAACRPDPDGPWVVASYHTSRYNIQTGRMTEDMFLGVLEKVRDLAGGENG
ncbi:MAG: uracil-DNA glycosylase [Desulfuromonadales bacterium]|jgi:uracil-DNA glycosylase family 4